MSLLNKMSRETLELGEIALLLVFWTFSMGIYAWSHSYAGFSGRFPRLFAGLVVLGSTLLLIRNWLPRPLYSLVTGSIGLGRMSEEFDEGAELSVKSNNEAQQNATDLPLTDIWFVSVSVGGFFVLSYLIGMIWAAPCYAVIYSVWYRKSMRYTLSMMVISFIICYAFFSVLNIQITTGLIHEFMGIV